MHLIPLFRESKNKNLDSLEYNLLYNSSVPLFSHLLPPLPRQLEKNENRTRMWKLSFGMMHPDPTGQSQTWPELIRAAEGRWTWT